MDATAELDQKNRADKDEGRRRASGNFSGSVLCIRGLVSSIAAGPGRRRRSGFWQETTFWGRVSEMGGRGHSRVRHHFL